MVPDAIVYTAIRKHNIMVFNKHNIMVFNKEVCQLKEIEHHYVVGLYNIILETTGKHTDCKA